jgi:hypothetical protein
MHMDTRRQTGLARAIGSPASPDRVADLPLLTIKGVSGVVGGVKIQCEYSHLRRNVLTEALRGGILGNAYSP